MIKVFESERIDYVKVDPNLINDYLKMINDRELQGFIGLSNITISFDQEMEWVRENMKSDSTTYSMIEKDTNEFIGNIEVMHIENNKAEIGICITRDKQDKHFGKEAMDRIIKYCYEELKLDEVYLNVHSDNPRAIKCYENCGFKITGEGKRPSDYHMIHQKEKENDKEYNI